MRYEVIISLLVFSLSGFAAPQPVKQINPVEEVHNVLKMPIKSRIKEAKSFDLKKINELERIVFSETESLEDRWRAVTVLGRSFPIKSRGVLDRALSSDTWFLRNAAVTVLKYNDRTWAVNWLEKLMNDPALVVRTSAVKTIEEIGAIETQKLLWKKLYSKENYKNGKSLWVRKYIARALVKFATMEDEKRFLKLRNDKDIQLRPIAQSGLKKMGSVLSY